ncbi:thiopurine S-methyltransferase [Vibrio zhanjiangensis]|uniref:Thiopurine S-methyltransferase n=1 Tax=Vibrio zhanjiangensis TaxID=1046128 RepID=A0ABQ6ETH9_9VIBR|nr:thiopurine S-methyltransferase [Vibrio zhanjiangensis]GLT16465.1 thiopurine S-methyltransferase [Vibrio zhanjiangensis]
MKDPEFWHSRWAANKIGFHLDDVNPLLIEFWSETNPDREDKVFVPLCGKTEDLIWLASKHEHVQGVELSEIAVRSFFAEHFYTPMVTSVTGQHDLHQFDEISIYTGDIFTAPLESVDLVYDRAALVALPEPMRCDYARRIKELLNSGGRILLITTEYHQEEMAGPPFSVTENEVNRLFPEYKISKLHRDEADQSHPRVIKYGLSKFAEEVYLLES